MKTLLKILGAGLASLPLLIAFGMLLSGLNILGTSDVNIPLILFFVFIACFSLAWLNSESVKSSFIGALVGIIVGLPFGFFLAQIGFWLANVLFPLKNLSLSGSLGAGLLILGIAIAVLVATGRSKIVDNWKIKVIFVVLLLISIYAMELVTGSIYGITSSSSVVKMYIYFPVIWGAAFGIVNLGKENELHSRYS